MTMPGYADQSTAVQKPLRRIERQIRGLQRLVEEDQYCVNLLDQISATTRAAQAGAMKLRGDHLSHCVMEALFESGPTADAEGKAAQDAVESLVRP